MLHLGDEVTRYQTSAELDSHVRCVGVGRHLKEAGQWISVLAC